jgi:hypothetical protein
MREILAKYTQIEETFVCKEKQEKHESLEYARPKENRRENVNSHTKQLTQQRHDKQNTDQPS